MRAFVAGLLGAILGTVIAYAGMMACFEKGWLP